MTFLYPDQAMNRFLLRRAAATATTEDKSTSSTTSSSTSSSSSACSGKNANSAECQKPETTNALTISLATILPVVLIVCVLSYFVWMNYRKDKKEALEHDPDFDENGEATALPDLPNNHFENPFHNRNSVRYPGEYQVGEPLPMGVHPPFHGTGAGKMSRGSIRSESLAHGSDPYLDHFVLPYQHQTGSKASLDDYARHLGDMPGYSSRGSTLFDKPKPSSRSATPQPSVPSSPSRSSHLRSQYESNRAEPTGTDIQMQNLQNYSQSGIESYPHDSVLPEPQTSPLKKVDGKQYTNIPNYSTSSLSRKEETSSDVESDVDDLFASTYEKKYPGVESGEEKTATSPFDDSNTNTSTTVDEKHEQHNPFPNLDDTQEIEGDFNFSTDTSPEASNIRDSSLVGDSFDQIDQSLVDRSLLGDQSLVVDEDTHNPPVNSLTIPPTEVERRKSPRISAFNLLKNDSEDEDDGHAVNEEQEEELKRMKSVYRVYFDGTGEDGSPNPNVESANDEFKVDHSNPLPTLQVPGQKAVIPQHERINSSLRMDTDYNKRLTTTSSIYTETNLQGQHDDYGHDNNNNYDYNNAHQNDPYQQGTYQQDSYQYDPNQQGAYQQDQYPEGAYQEGAYQQGAYQQGAYQQDPYQQRAYQQGPNDGPARPLPPLQALRNASDIRNSTLQTYTDFRPHKQQVTSPSQAQFGVDGWSSPKNSPAIQSQTSFNSSGSNGHPSILPASTSQTNISGQTQYLAPSASQMARASVVMINPVTEITKGRTFKPAGSLPSAAPQATQFGASMHEGDSDLIPGNRKSDVRRMMNSNF